MFPPVFSGPKHHILRASSLSQSNSSDNNLALNLGSSFGVTFPFSISSGNFSCRGCAYAYNLLCLFGDLAIQTMFDVAVTVSLYETMGSDLMISH